MRGRLDERGQDPVSVNLGNDNWSKSAAKEVYLFVTIILAEIEIALNQRRKWNFRQEAQGNGWTKLYCISSLDNVCMILNKEVVVICK